MLSRLEAPLKKAGLLTHLEEVFAGSPVLAHCRRHTCWQGLWTLAAHRSRIDDTLGRQAGAAHMAAQVELTG